GSLVGLMVVLGVAAVIIAQSDWLREKVRKTIITEVEQATGGKVDIASFSFDWHLLRAQVRDFVVHGTEPASGPPLLRASLLQVDLKILALFKPEIDLAALLIREPQVHITVDEKGRTNIPEPKAKSKSSNKSPTETILDLAI